MPRVFGKTAATTLLVLSLLMTGCLQGDVPAEPLTSGIQGRVWVGPTCPVERDPPEPGCEDKPLATRLVVMSPDLKRRITEFESAENGTFRVGVPPGDYAIRSASQNSTPPSCSTDTIRVAVNNYTEVRIDCDSGIR